MEPWVINLGLAGVIVLVVVIVFARRLIAVLRVPDITKTMPKYVRCVCGQDFVPSGPIATCPNCGSVVDTSGASHFSQADRERRRERKPLDENNPDAWFLIADELAKQDRMDEAREYMEKGLSLQKQQDGRRRK